MLPRGTFQVLSMVSLVMAAKYKAPSRRSIWGYPSTGMCSISVWMSAATQSSDCTGRSTRNPSAGCLPGRRRCYRLGSEVAVQENFRAVRESPWGSVSLSFLGDIRRGDSSAALGSRDCNDLRESKESRDSKGVNTTYHFSISHTISEFRNCFQK